MILDTVYCEIWQFDKSVAKIKFTTIMTNVKLSARANLPDLIFAKGFSSVKHGSN